MKNLFLKHVPLTLDEVIGHGVVIEELKKRSKDFNFSNVMLLTGMTGIGKTVLARIISKTLLCNDKDEKGYPCNKCDTCLSIINENPILNYEEINASNFGKDEVRSLVEKSKKRVSFTKSEIKVFYIDELQEMKSKDAITNLLKILERPVENTYWILGSMGSLDSLEKAIRNRGVHYKLSSPDIIEIAEYLYTLAERENYKVDTDEKEEIIISISENCGGSVRQAVSWLERVIYSEITDINTLMKELSIVSNKDLVEIINCIIHKKVEIFDYTIDKDVIKNIKYRLIILYKHFSDIELTPWEAGQVKGINIKGIKIEDIVNILEYFNDLFNYVYVDNYLINFTLLNILNRDKKSIDIQTGMNNNTTEPKRRSRRKG